MKSSCCGAELHVFQAGEGTCHYDCMSCGKPCDATASYTGSTGDEPIIKKNHSDGAVWVTCTKCNRDYECDMDFEFEELPFAKSREFTKEIDSVLNGKIEKHMKKFHSKGDERGDSYGKADLKVQELIRERQGMSKREVVEMLVRCLTKAEMNVCQAKTIGYVRFIQALRDEL